MPTINEYPTYTPTAAFSLEQTAEMLNQPMQFILDIVSGKLAQQGYTPNRAILQQLMGYGPQLGEAITAAGYEYDPRWIQQYIRPGAVDPKTWADLMEYARSFLNTQWEQQGVPMLDQYTIAGFMTPWKKQQLLANDIANRYYFAGMQVNPITGQLEQVPELQTGWMPYWLHSILNAVTQWLDRRFGGGGESEKSNPKLGQ